MFSVHLILVYQFIQDSSFRKNLFKANLNGTAPTLPEKPDDNHSNNKPNWYAF